MIKEKEINFISAVVYVDELSIDIHNFLRSLISLFENRYKNFEIICVDDYMNNNVIESQIYQAKEETNCKALTIMRMAGRGKKGLEICMTAGRDFAIGDYIFEFDTTYKDYDVSVVTEAYQKILSGYDVVTARSLKQKDPIESRIFYKVFNSCSNLSYELESDRFRVMSRKAVNRAEEFSKISPYRKAVYSACGLNIARIEYNPVPCRETKRPDSAKWETASDAIVLFTNVAYRISMFFSIMLSLVMLGFGIYVIIVYIGKNKPVEGWAPMMGMICLGFLVVFILMTIHFKYIEVILSLLFRKQQYIVSSVERL